MLDCANVVGADSKDGKSSVKNCKNGVKSKFALDSKGNCPTFVADAGLLVLNGDRYTMRKYILSYLGAWFCLFTPAVAQQISYSEQHLQVALRDIGHRLLWYAGDSTSRVLPVEKISELQYQISFQNAFTFEPDTLVRLTQERLKETLPGAQYVVSVMDCSTEAVFFAFEINNRTDSALVPCSGRIQPEGCYRIHIEFLGKPTPDFAWAYCALLVPIGLLGFWTLRKRRKTPEDSAPSADDPQGIAIGTLQFFPEKNRLFGGGAWIELSEKEAKLLSLLLETPNQTVARAHLMKVLWEDEGTIVISRNLDVLVSKLRKKLQPDEQVKITNVHAKGYKLVQGE